ncbi:MAG: nuclear transport factor 2 family protein [Methylocystaceae bacterium]|nr:nuclear transport factor 2 family protein [Methylocystaceae bacterium]
MKYIDLFENLTPEAIANCDEIVSPDIHFKDPFNDFKGIEIFKRMMFKTLKEVRDPKFHILDQACSETRHYVRWDFEGRVTGLGLLTFSGMSEIVYDDEQRVIEHIDHWDASEQLYEKLPVLGWPITCLKKRLRVS